MQIKSIFNSLLIFFIVYGAYSFSFAKESSKQQLLRKESLLSSSKVIVTDKSTFPTPPKLKDNEYAIFIEDSYKTFKTKIYEKLELSESCFKKSKPVCQAYEFSKIKPKNLDVKYPGLDNISAIHCENVGGRNLIALDYKHNQYNFCRFDDGTMVNSWSMNYKQFPSMLIK